jgi:hypothetical protein
MPICPAEGCRQPILENQPTIKLSPGTLMRGKKTGGFYHSATFEVDIIIHYGCVFRFFHPQADAEMYDLFYEMVHSQVRREEMDDMKEEVMAEAADDLTTLCPECREDRLHPDRPPEEHQCDSCGSCALPVCPDCGSVQDPDLEQDRVQPDQRYAQQMR